jgi:hypothetical protein
MDQTLITMALVFFTEEQTVVLSSLLVAARRIVGQVDILLSSYSIPISLCQCNLAWSCKLYHILFDQRITLLRQ